MPAGIGSYAHYDRKLDSILGGAILSIQAMKAVEIGDGCAVSTRLGSVNNDAFRMENNTVVKATNHAGGILGGISDGSDIILRAAVKPTPSISRPQSTVTKDGLDTTIEIHGRHDPCIVPRAVVVVEAMAAITILDALLLNMTAKLDNIKKFYE